MWSSVILILFDSVRSETIMSQLDLNKLTEVSKVLGLTGQALIDFIREQNDLSRDERAKKREEA